ncbi:MAG: AmmeMemoRadiSam system protein A [Phycisphaerae bacterium]|nr:AmmeMemoRadiSam system protein A [Phycisphaerae bacterium]
MTNQELQLSDEQKRTLLALARRVVNAEVAGTDPAPAEPPGDPVLNLPCGCFVTLHVAGQLRGCIGTFQANAPLHRTVAEMAQAALADPRFTHQRLRTVELDELDIEISVLSPLEKTDDPMSLELGKHGIYIRRGYRTGCFLPQVATETGWDREQYLSYCCSHKAGLAAGAWKDRDTEVYLFTAEVFSEGQLGKE